MVLLFSFLFSRQEFIDTTYRTRTSFLPLYIYEYVYAKNRLPFFPIILHIDGDSLSVSKALVLKL